MDLFKFLKKDRTTFYNGDKNSFEKIIEGILFEDNYNFLKWGYSIDSLASNNEVIIEEKGDRTIYKWGEHTILNGLKLPLHTMFWKFGKDLFFRKFRKIEFVTIGDSEKYFEIISNHLEKQLGKPQKEEYINPEKLKEWIVNDVKLRLYLFDMHSLRLAFTISKIS